MKTFTCNLASKAKKHIQFLKDKHASDSIFLSPKTNANVSSAEKESLRRYHDLWLPLVVAATSNKPGLQLIPPPDIAWLWHCHRLAPQQYCTYCEKTFNGRIIDANPPFAVAREDYKTKNNSDHEITTASVISHTKDLWKDAYPNENFYLHSDLEKIDNSIHPLLTVKGFDLIGSARRQTSFLWQVSGEHYGQKDFLKQGVQNYENFLRLTTKAKELGIILVPTFQIDLMWHTHILNSVKDYNTDCIRIMNTTMYHDDSFTDRDEGSIVDVSYTATQKLWKNAYGTEYFVHGGMYRGEPPPEYYSTTWSCTMTDKISRHTENNVKKRKQIGQVGAASSTSRLLKSLSTQTQYTKVDGYASDGRPAFIRTDHETKRDSTNLPYVFGTDVLGTGYYHIETYEAQTILQAKHTSIHNSEAASNDKWSMFDVCMFCGLWNVIYQVKVAPTTSDEENNKATKMKGNDLSIATTSSDSTASTGMLNACCDQGGTGGACGGGGYVYSDFGGGGCGGGGCGGGGCGGGGCGGGGCGGGGCGGG